MAVAAHEGHLYLYTLRSMDDMERQIKQRARLSPILSVGIISSLSTSREEYFTDPPTGTGATN